jgi:hypothetical protein
VASKEANINRLTNFPIEDSIADGVNLAHDLTTTDTRKDHHDRFAG